MTSPTENPLNALNALLEERARYERWLAQLAERREQTPTHVFERVRRDYSGRLDGVMVQLRSRGAELEGTAASLEERVNALLAEETSRRDARAEVELRALVGEFGSDRAQSELNACDADIARFVADRTAIATELHRVQEILDLVKQPVSTGIPARAPAPDDTSFDELAFLQSVVEQPSPAPAHAAEPPRALNGPLPIGRSGPQPAVRPSAQARPASTPSATPAFLKDMPTEQVKTLKCQECGTMNYPTEWYCERCGGELAAM